MNQLVSRRQTLWPLQIVTLSLLLLLLTGCAPTPSTPQQLAIFQAIACPPPPVLPLETALARVPNKAYRVIPGDGLELDMPQVMRVVMDVYADSDRIEPYLARVRSNGTIILPVIGEVNVAGMSLAQVEEAVAEAYYPSHLVNRPSVVARMAEYSTSKVSVTGAVNRPGLYELRNNEMSLMASLMKAGGIARSGATSIVINKPDGQVITLRVDLNNIPAADIVLEGGETVQVESVVPTVFNVTGLVKKPGEFEYPNGTTYNVLQALGAAGGVDDIADPYYIRIIRPRTDCEGVMEVVVSIAPDDLLASAPVGIMPGDSVYALSTSRTDTRQVLYNLSKRLGIFFGVTYRIDSD